MKKLVSSVLSIFMLFSFVFTPRSAFAEEDFIVGSKINDLAKNKMVKSLDESFYKELCKQIDRINPKTEEALNELLKPVVDKMLGFKYDPKKDIYYSREDSLQKFFGFGDLYDKLGPLLGMNIDELPVVFRYAHKDGKEKEWLIEFWKGQYAGGLSIGAEIGVYNRLVEEGMEEYVPGNYNYKVFFNSVKGKEKMFLSYVLCDKKGRAIFARNSSDYEKPDGEPQNKDWWLLGIKLGKYGKSENLIMKPGIRFLSKEMAKKFAEAAEQQFPQKIKDLRQDGRIVTFTWG